MSASTPSPTAADLPPAKPPRAEPRFSTRGWAGKAVAGTLLGFTLAIGLSGVLAGLTPGGLAPQSDRVQFHMWLVAPLWMAVISTCFLFRTAWRAWGWLLLLNALAFGGLAALRHLAAA